MVNGEKDEGVEKTKTLSGGAALAALFGIDALEQLAPPPQTQAQEDGNIYYLDKNGKVVVKPLDTHNPNSRP